MQSDRPMDRASAARWSDAHQWALEVLLCAEEETSLQVLRREGEEQERAIQAAGMGGTEQVGAGRGQVLHSLDIQLEAGFRDEQERPAERL